MSRNNDEHRHHTLLAAFHTGAFRSAFLAGVVIVLIASNVLLLTSSVFFSTASGFISALPFADLITDSPSQKQKKLEVENNKLRKRNQALIAERKRFHAKVKNARSVSKRIAQRTARNVALDMSTMVAEATPYVGIAFVVASTALDVKDGCDTVRDVNEILDSLNDEKDHAMESQVCGVEVPSAEEVASRIKRDIGETIGVAENSVREKSGKFQEALGGTIDQAMTNMNESARSFKEKLGGTINEILN